MKHLKGYKAISEGTVVDHRRDMSELSKDLHEKGVKYVYFLFGNVYEGFFFEKFEIPEKYRGESEEEYTGGDYGRHYKDTAEYIEMMMDELDAITAVLDYQVEDLINSLNSAISDKNPEKL